MGPAVARWTPLQAGGAAGGGSAKTAAVLWRAAWCCLRTHFLVSTKRALFGALMLVVGCMWSRHEPGVRGRAE